ncbi:MAG TPA: DUF3078 domain-containing protein [Brumimicrobium sp.]|nr:DUF3078 domain-containing protein [Brumimicrobium sp.]
MKLIKITLLGLLSVFIVPSLQAQDDSDLPPKEPSNWKLESIFSLNVTQSSFTNWASGGRNNISGLGFINANADYSKDRVKWSNQLTTGIGGVQYFDEELEKTDDVIDLQSTFSYGMKDPWYLSVLGGFRTQYLDGFSNPEDSTRSSTFMAPGYVNLSLGVEYIPNENFKVMLSPLSGKFTFVNDQVLANEGAFGVNPAEYSSMGALLKKGDNFRAEMGSYLRIVYKKELMENINLRSRVEFFSNYIDNPQNIDINGELILDFKINKWFSANVQLNVIYDDDIKIEDRKGNVGPRTQFKQVIGLGIAYRLANFEEKKK